MHAWRPDSEQTPTAERPRGDIDQAPTRKWPRAEIDQMSTRKWPRAETSAIDQMPTLPLPSATPHARLGGVPGRANMYGPRAPHLVPGAPGRHHGGTTRARLTRFVDRLSGGRAAVLGRLTTYLLFGGTAALINLGVFAAALRLPLPIPDFARNLVAFAVAAEVATIANFIPNDQITFRHLAGYSRVWWQRCLRFHVTCAAGTALTYAIQAGLHYGVGAGALAAEAIALVIVTAFNFTTHHLFTYARTRGAAGPMKHPG